MIAGTNIAKVVGAGGAQGWDDTLLIDDHSGAKSPIIDTGQHLRFGTGAPTQVTGDIRSDGSLFIHPDTGFEVQAHDSIHMHGPDSVLIESTGGSQVKLASSATVALESTAGPVTLTAGTFVSVNNFLRFTEQAASTPSLAAGQALFWARNDAPNVPMFTDDTNVDHVLQYRGEGMLADGDKTDIVVSGGFLTWTIDTNVVSNTKFRQSAGFSIVGRAGSTTGNVADITASVAGEVLKLNNAGTSLLFGQVSTAGLEDGAVTNPKAADMAANTIKANPTAALADPQDFAVVAESVVGRTSGNFQNITSSVQSALIRGAGSMFWATAAADQVMRRSGSGDLGFGTLVTNNIGDNQVTFPKIEDIATARILGRVTAGAGDIEELTGTQATTLLDNFTSALKGLAPASGGGTANFLRADGTWTAPPGTVTAGHQLRNNGVLMTQRGFINFLSSTTVTFLTADDAVNNETEVIWHVNRTADYLWTVGTHEFAGLDHLINVTGTAQMICAADLTIGTTTGGLWIGAGYTPVVSPSVTNTDAVLVASGGIAISAGAATPPTNPATGNLELEAEIDAWLSTITGGIMLSSEAAHPTGVTNGFIDFRSLLSVRVFTAAVERLEISSTGEWQLAGDVGDEGAVLTSQGAAAPPLWLPPTATSNWLVIRDDFTGGHRPFGFEQGTIGETGWLDDRSGDADGSVFGIQGEDNHPGIIRLSTGLTSQNIVCIYRGQNNSAATVTNGVATPNDIDYIEWVVRLPATITSATFRVGLFENIITSAGGTTGLFFTLSPSTDATWHIEARNASVSTNQDTGITGVANTWYKLVMRRVSTTSFEFFINDVSGGTITTNVPTTTSVQIGASVENLTAADRTFDVDFALIYGNSVGRF
jgi:hypothetical protein